MDGYKLRNQERELYNVTMRDIREFTNIMAEDNDEFIVLYAPEKINGITFLQASRYGGGRRNQFTGRNYERWQT